jgi:hypothetical protein
LKASSTNPGYQSKKGNPCMRKPLQDNKTRCTKARFFVRLILRLVLAAVIGGFIGKLIQSSVRPQQLETGGVMPEPEVKPHQSPRRLEMDLPSPESRVYLSQIRRLPTLDSREFFKLAQNPAGGAALQNAVLSEWAKRFPKEMFQTLHAAFPSEDDPRSKWSELAVIQWMRQNPDEAIAALDGLPRKIGSGGSDPHQSAIAAAKNSGDFGLALDLESRWPNQVWSGDTEGAFENWYAKQPSVTLAKIAKIGHAGLRASYIYRIGRLAAGGSEEEILETAASFSTLDRRAFMKGITGSRAVFSLTESSRTKSVRRGQTRHPRMVGEGSASGDPMEHGEPARQIT